ncbi:hypothetical protein J6590_070348 [Homalodisca vitripennis]|nr:hypothetical protein J6590_070348 [Homalodisca vitripennis]
MPLSVTGAGLLVCGQGRGQYDTRERQTVEVLPAQFKTLRNSILPDPALYEEVMFHVMSYVAPTDSANPLCSNHSIRYQEAFLQDQLWALKMMDASSKLGDGIMEGNIQGLGSYDECLSVTEPRGQFRGQLCVIQTRGVLPPVVANPAPSQYSLIPALPLDMTMSVCVPSTCSVADIRAHWQQVASELNITVDLSDSDCSTRGDIRPGAHTRTAL